MSDSFEDFKAQCKRDHESTKRTRKTKKKPTESKPKSKRLARFKGGCTPDFREYMKSKKWRKKARRARDAADYKCERCAREGRLVVHHKTYERLFFEPLSDLIVLCHICARKKPDEPRVQHDEMSREFRAIVKVNQ
jgi:hypothetical protein